MDLFVIMLIAIGLALDCFAVSVCAGMTKKIAKKNCLENGVFVRIFPVHNADIRLFSGNRH
jgi:putative Mn2+ efflux pump MntP